MMTAVHCQNIVSCLFFFAMPTSCRLLPLSKLTPQTSFPC